MKATPSGIRELFPHVRADVAAKVVEFDAIVSPMLVPDPKAPLFYLETIVCTPDTREHETLFVTDARPSHVHAAMLIVGLKPGEPGGWKLVNDRLAPIDPAGDRIAITISYMGPTGPVEVDPLAWVVNARNELPILESVGVETGRAAPGWVFAGSRIVSGRRAVIPPTDGAEPPAEIYDADESGSVIGLASFGAETIAWARTFSPDASVDAPEWIVKMDAIPAAGTPVVVRIRPAP